MWHLPGQVTGASGPKSEEAQTQMGDETCATHAHGKQPDSTIASTQMASYKA
eukprot:CAMPEP_0174322966 /NCGR_PEP_ID=MMETSP0810-20121108/11432_1 /TAXON_ID=73025 ORGANISM="Eutreptiella gymnastica-like, Strain CCMP1594" /NCGR_SAMPLE_ID=MMETSP0810 /ASSEMBLY_ACC=CAM_ASM_000659 /LENGTH=51 /DNA_ID=CAMNT_0015435115 /DNA_START=171 /DNA_END=326 /DNA_ORIENTATION=+